MPRIVLSGLSANFPPTCPNVDGRVRSSDGGNKPACHQHLADNLGESVHLACGQRLGLGDQVLIARRVARGDQVNAQGRSRCAEVGRDELVDDRGDVGRGVLGCLAILGVLGRNQHFYGNGHGFSRLNNWMLLNTLAACMFGASIRPCN